MSYQALSQKFPQLQNFRENAYFKLLFYRLENQVLGYKGRSWGGKEIVPWVGDLPCMWPTQAQSQAPLSTARNDP